jgi:molybdopterin-binding protein
LHGPEATGLVRWAVEEFAAFTSEVIMLSASNQFHGKVKSVKLGGVMAEVVVTVGDLEFVSAITRASAEGLDLKAGDDVTAIIKSTEVLIGKG